MLRKIKWLVFLPAFPVMVIWFYSAGKIHRVPLTFMDNVRICFETWLEGYKGK